STVTTNFLFFTRAVYPQFTETIGADNTLFWKREVKEITSCPITIFIEEDAKLIVFSVGFYVDSIINFVPSNYLWLKLLLHVLNNFIKEKGLKGVFSITLVFQKRTTFNPERLSFTN